MWQIITIIISILAVGISWRNYALSKGRLEKFESNCIATLQADMKTVKDSVADTKKHIEDIYKEQKSLGERVSKIEGRLNGGH